jgi:hypothetical protein
MDGTSSIIEDSEYSVEIRIWRFGLCSAAPSHPKNTTRSPKRQAAINAVAACCSVTPPSSDPREQSFGRRQCPFGYGNRPFGGNFGGSAILFSLRGGRDRLMVQELEMVAQACFEELRDAYDEAFERLRREVRLMHSSNPEGTPPAVDDSARRVEQAERAYRQSRDELADFMIAQQPRAAAAACNC